MLYVRATRTRLLRAVRTESLEQLVPGGARTVRTPSAYQPRACCTHRRCRQELHDVRSRARRAARPCAAHARTVACTGGARLPLPLHRCGDPQRERLRPSRAQQAGRRAGAAPAAEQGARAAAASNPLALSLSLSLALSLTPGHRRCVCARTRRVACTSPRSPRSSSPRRSTRRACSRPCCLAAQWGRRR